MTDAAGVPGVGDTPEVTFVLAKFPSYPDPAQVIASAARRGITLALVDQQDAQVYALDAGRSLLVMLVAAPYPDAPDDAPAHFILTAFGLSGSRADIDAQMTQLTAAVAENVVGVSIT